MELGEYRITVLRQMEHVHVCTMSGVVHGISTTATATHMPK